MKRWVLYLAAFGLVLGLNLSPFSPTDVGKLRPVQLVRVSRVQGIVRLETDTGDSGSGGTLAEALANLKMTTPDSIFLDTAEHLILQPGCEDLLSGLSELLRPSCGICTAEGEAELVEAAEYLSAHEPQVTIQDWQCGERKLPILRTERGRMELVS